MALGVAAPVLRRREIELLQHVAQLADEGMPAAGIRRVLDLEERIGRLEDRLASEADRPAGEPPPAGRG